MSAPPDDLAAVLERCRAHRAALTRHVTLAPDSLHRVLRCSRCQAWNLDTRVYPGLLQLGDGGRRACMDLDELRAFVATQHRALHKLDRLDPCRCGAPAVALSLVAARFFHAPPGSGAELLVEVRYAADEVAGMRFGRCALGGGVAFFDDVSEELIRQHFGVPLTVWGVWRAVIAADEGALASVEEGMALGAFPAAGAALRRQLDEALAGDPDLRAYGLSARVTADPSWRWLRDDPTIARRPETVLVMMLRNDVLAARVALLAAARGAGCRREGDTVWVEDGTARWPVELPTVAEEGLRRGFTLSAMAAAAVTHALDRAETIRTFLGAIEKLRPGVSFAHDGMRVVVTHEGVAGRPIDLRTAPFGEVADLDALERDLRFYLHEAPPWSDPWRVCPCGAARVASLHRWDRAALGALGAPPAELVRADESPPEGPTVLVYGLSCDRHVEHSLGPLLERHGRTVASLREQCVADLDRQRFAVKVARYHDAAGRAAALVEGPNLLDATAHPRLTAGLVEAALGGARAARVHTLSRALAVVGEDGVDEALVEKLREAGPLLWTVRHGGAPAPVREAFASDASTTPAGRFELVENEPAGASGARRV